MLLCYFSSGCGKPFAATQTKLRHFDAKGNIGNHSPLPAQERHSCRHRNYVIGRKSFMDTQVGHIELVKQAQLGSQECMDRLALQANTRLPSYLFRLTLDQDITQDLLQETLLEMVKSLKTLRHADRFWPWLYRIALSKAQHYFRNRQQKVTVHTSVDITPLPRNMEDSYNDGLNSMIRQELAEAIFESMGKLKLEYRDIIILRCFEQLSYAEIAEAAGSSEVRARALFFRAKRVLKGHLARRGFSKWMFIIGLGLFARKTALAGASSSATTVTVASTKVGLLGTTLGVAGTKMGITATAAVTAAVLVIGGMATLTENNNLPERSEVKSFYYTEQLRNTYPGAEASSLSVGAYERWYYFPEDIDGPMFWRSQRWTPDQKNKLCSWLTNGQGEYYYHAGKKTVSRYNRYPFSKIKTLRLPSDPPAFIDFLNKVEGNITGVDYTRDKKTGLLTHAVDERFVNARNFHTCYEYNTLDESCFRYDWPAEIPVIECRDTMHQRGWTYFRMTGELHGKSVLARGQIPFVYDAVREHPPWLRIQVGDRREIADTPAAAYDTGPYGIWATTYPPGSFFKGLNRPWIGISTLNIIRRDAAAHRLWFETQIWGEYPEEKVQVTVVNDPQNPDATLEYRIDPLKDLIESIKITTRTRAGTKHVSTLKFEYLEEVDQAEGEFSKPSQIETFEISPSKRLESLWLMELAENTLQQ